MRGTPTDDWTMRRTISWYLENNIALSKDDRAPLERLLADDRAEKVWEIIKAHAERHCGRSHDGDAPLLFIIHILDTKAAAEIESIGDAEITTRAVALKRLKIRTSREIDRIAKNVPIKERPKFWKLVCEWLERQPPAAVPLPRVRSDRNGSRARTYFMRDMSNFVHDVTGYRLDEQVGVIAEIILGTNDCISADAVRKARSK